MVRVHIPKYHIPNSNKLRIQEMWTEISKLSWSKSFCFDAFYFSLFVLEMQCCKTKQFQGFFLVFFDYSSQTIQACKWSLGIFFSNRNADQEQQEKKKLLKILLQ